MDKDLETPYHLSILQNFTSILMHFSGDLDAVKLQGKTFGKDILILHALLLKQMTLNALQQEVPFPISTLSRRVDNLVSNGYIKRKMGKQDRRETFLRITQKGRNILEEFFKYMKNKFSPFFGKIDLSEEKNLSHLLEIFLRTVKNPK